MKRSGWFVAIALVAVLLTCFPAIGSSTGKEVVVYGWAGTWDLYFKEWAQAFEKKTGTKVLYVSGSTVGQYSKLLAEKDRPQADVWVTAIPYTFIGKAENLIRDVPWERMTNAQDIPSIYKFPHAAWVAVDIYMIAYNTRLVSKEERPTKWIDLADPKWKGRAIQRPPLMDISAFVFLALKRAYGEAKAWEYIDKMYKNATTWPESPGDFAGMLAKGEGVVAPSYMGNITISAVDMGAPIMGVVPEEGAVLGGTAAALVRNSPNPQGGEEFLNFLLGPLVQSDLCNRGGFGFAVNSTVKLTNLKLRDIGLGGMDPKEAVARSFVLDYAYLQEKPDGQSTRLQILLKELERRVKGL